MNFSEILRKATFQVSTASTASGRLLKLNFTKYLESSSMAHGKRAIVAKSEKPEVLN